MMLFTFRIEKLCGYTSALETQGVSNTPRLRQMRYAPYLHAMQGLHTAHSLLVGLHLNKGDLLAPVGMVVQHPA